MKSPLWQRLSFLLPLVLATPVQASNAGWIQMQLAGGTPEGGATTVALYYPTSAVPRSVAMGPFMLDVAIGGEAEATVKGLIVLSHGLAGSELAHSSLAQALARHGYLVAALRHPGDNWQDRSMLVKNPAMYFEERPRQVSRVIDALLADPRWKDRIRSDERGPRVGAIGHSAGGYTVLALAGALPDLSRMGRHCRDEAKEDPILCGVSRQSGSMPVARPLASAHDERVRAVVAMAPLGIVFTAESLAAVRPVTMVYEAELDRFLVPRFHAEWIANNLPAAHLHRVPNAWHFAFMDTPTTSIPTEDGDAGADPPGFDRKAALQRFAIEIVEFFDSALR